MHKDIFGISSSQDFEDVAFKVFTHQFENNRVYRSFCDLLYVHPSGISNLEEIPFLPIEFFKKREVVSSEFTPQKVFTSSGTTGSLTSKHLVTDISLYEESFRKGFHHFYGGIQD